MEMNLIFIHEHNVNISTAKKISNNCYSIDGYLDAKKNDNMKLKAFDIYFSIFCRKCDKYLLKTRASQDFVVISKKMTGLKNYFNDQGKIESVYLDDNPSKNILDSEDAIRLPFYKLNTMPIYDNKTIYVGTDEEQKDFFHQKYIELKNKSDDISKKEQEIKKYDGRIIIKGDSEKLPDAYHIIIGANSILSLNNDGWEIKYPKQREVYEDLKTKPMIIVGVVGNRNKGKSFILGKLTDYKVPQGFSIKTEGISVCFGDKEDHCIAILDSAGQEVPLLQSANNLKEKNKEKENKKQNEIKIENDKENIKAGFTKSLADRLDSISEIAVKEAENDDIIKPGQVYIAPGNFHLRIAPIAGGGRKIVLSQEPPVGNHRPAVNVMYDSAAQFGKDLVAVIMTGMGSDGCEGMKKIKAQGGYSIAQDEASCVVYGMPKSVVDAGLADEIQPLTKIAEAIVEAVRR